MKLHCQVPGKLLLAGEYDVLFGGGALCFTTPQKLTLSVEINPHFENQLEITSDYWGQDFKKTFRSTPSSTELKDPLIFAAFSEFWQCEENPVLIKVHVDQGLSPKWGLGSSSALQVGMIKLRHLMLENHHDRLGYFEQTKIAWQAWNRQRTMQGLASGYDCWIQSQGGLQLIAFNYPSLAELGQIKQEQLLTTPILEERHWLKYSWDLTPLLHQSILNQYIHVFVGGHGAPTTATIQKIFATSKGSSNNVLPLLLDAVSKVRSTLMAWLMSNMSSHVFPLLCQAIFKQREIFSQCGLMPMQLATILSRLPDCDRLWTFKTSGAGGEDAFIIFGEKEIIDKIALTTFSDLGWHRLPLWDTI